MHNPNNPNKKYLRVTEVLYPFSGLSTIDKATVENAAKRGTKVHKICEGIIGGLGEIGVDEDVKGYIDSFKKWWGTGHAVECMERRFWHDDLGITGQIDIILKDGQKLTIVDLKTSYRPSKTWCAQLCAYALLAKNAGIQISHIMVVHLHRNGKEPTIYQYPIDEKLFLDILRIYKYFFEDENKYEPFNP